MSFHSTFLLFLVTLGIQIYVATVEKVEVFVVLNYVFLPEMVFPLELESRHHIAELSYQIIAHLKIILIVLVGLKAVNAPLALMYIGRPILYHRLLYSRVAGCMEGSLLHTLLPGSLLKSEGQDICS